MCFLDDLCDDYKPSPAPLWRLVFGWLVVVLFIVGMALILILGCVSIAYGQSREVPAQLYRDTLYVGDPLRDFSVIWSRGDTANPKNLGLVLSGDTGDLDTVYLRGQAGTFKATQPPLREGTQYESWHWKAFGLPAGIPPGKYEVVIAGRVKCVTDVLVGKPAQSLILAPGEYQTLSLRTGSTIRGYGCTLSGKLTVSPNTAITGLTIDGNVTGSFDNVVFDSCTFRRGMIGPNLETDRATLFKDCRFENYTVATISSGLFLRCVWVGRPALGGHNFCNERGTRLAVINGTFDDTDRGIIARPRWGDNSDNLYAGLWFKNIASTNNGDELLCVEGGPYSFNRNLVFGIRANGCNGSVLLFNAKANDNLFNNIRVPVDITGLAEQSGNVVQDSECEYVRINWPGNSKAINTRLKDVYSVGFMPRARNQASGDAQFWADTKFQAVFQDGSLTPTTTGSGLKVFNAAGGYLPVKGIAQ